MEPPAFVQGLVDEMEELFSQLEGGAILEAESEGPVEMPTLLELALRSELEAAELAGSWMPQTEDVEGAAGSSTNALTSVSGVTVTSSESTAKPEAIPFAVRLPDRLTWRPGSVAGASTEIVQLVSAGSGSVHDSP